MTSPADRFASTEEYYARYRPDYGAATVEYLVDRFDLDGGSRVLDLGCGTGQIAVPIAAHVGEVVGMDPNEAMLEYARERASEAGRENVTWVRGSDEDLHGGTGADPGTGLDADLGEFRLATMGRSFHWMDQPRTLDRLYDLTDPAGGVAILNDPEWLTRGGADWQLAAYSVVEEYLDVERTDEPTEEELENPWDELVAEHGFTDVAVKTIELEREWDLDSVVGYVFSLSYCSPSTFGDEKAAFEADLSDRLAEFDRYVQNVGVEVVSGRKR